MQEQNKNQKPASRASGVKKPAPKKPAPKKNDPLWERALIALFSGLLALDDAFKQSAVRVIEFYIEFFTGIPGAIIVRRAKKKKEKIAARREKLEKKRLEEAEKSWNTTDKKSEKDPEKKAAKNEKKALRRAKRRRTLSKVPAIVLLSIIVLELALIGGGGGIYLFKAVTSGAKSLSMSVVIGRNSAVSTTVPAEYAFESTGERPCFDMAFLAKQLGFLAYGNDSDMLYTLPGGQKLYVKDGSNTVYVDGNPASLKDAVRFERDRVYISIELLLNYTDGVGVNFDRANGKLTLLCPSAAAVLLLPARIESAEHPELT